MFSSSLILKPGMQYLYFVSSSQEPRPRFWRSSGNWPTNLAEPPSTQRGEYVVTEPNNRQILCTTCISAIFLSLGSHGDTQCSMTEFNQDFIHDDAILRTSTLFYRKGKLLVEGGFDFFCRHKSTCTVGKWPRVDIYTVCHPEAPYRRPRSG